MRIITLLDHVDRWNLYIMVQGRRIPFDAGVLNGYIWIFAF